MSVSAVPLLRPLPDVARRRAPFPFIGCGHFGQANTWLARQGARPVDW